MFLLAFLRVSATDVLARRVTLFFEKTPIKTALDEVAKQADFEWSYNPKIIDDGRRVSLAAQNWTVREALREMLGDGFQVKTSGNYLILKKQKPPKSELSGTLRDPKTGERLANATVFDRRTLRATTTDSSGFYSLKVKKRSEIVVAKLGYRDTVLMVSSDSPRFQKIEMVQNFPLSDSAKSPENWRETLQKSASVLEYFFAATLDRWTQVNVPDTLRRRFQLSFLPKIGTNRGLDAKVENDFSINILAGQSAAVRGVELAGLGNFTKKRVRGVQAAGLFNLVKGSAAGIQLAGLFNQTADTLSGVQAAGLVNSAGQIDGFAVQTAGLVNFSGKESAFEGVQIGGVLNVANEINGVQVSGIVNKARRVRGHQIGLFNSAKKMRGLQIGLFNQSKDLRGLQIGLINRSGGRVLPFFNW